VGVAAYRPQFSTAPVPEPEITVPNTAFEGKLKFALNWDNQKWRADPNTNLTLTGENAVTYGLAGEWIMNKEVVYRPYRNRVKVTGVDGKELTFLMGHGEEADELVLYDGRFEPNDKDVAGRLVCTFKRKQK
jgi:hypothetical protein